MAASGAGWASPWAEEVGGWGERQSIKMADGKFRSASPAVSETSASGGGGCGRSRSAHRLALEQDTRSGGGGACCGSEFEKSTGGTPTHRMAREAVRWRVGEDAGSLTAECAGGIEGGTLRWRDSLRWVVGWLLKGDPRKKHVQTRRGELRLTQTWLPLRRFMSKLEQTSFCVTDGDIRSYDWQSKIAQVPRRDCWKYCEAFGSGIKECTDAGDDLGRRVYLLLHAVASFQPNYDSRENAYGPGRWNSDGSRSIMAEDLSDDDLKALRGILEEITDFEFRARVGDVIWESQRDHKAAQIAVRAFLESARIHKTDDLWPPYTDRLDRAAQLSARLGFGQPLHQEVVAVLKAAVKEFVANAKSGLLCHHLMTTLILSEVPEVEEYAALAERLANEFAAAGESDFSHRYWELAARWWRNAKNEVNVQRCQIAGAEGAIEATEKSLNEKKLEYSQAAFWIGRAVEELRQAKGEPTRIKEIHRRFLELQQLALSQMKPMDLMGEEIPGFADAERQTQEAAANLVRGQSFEKAVGRLAFLGGPTDVQSLRAQMEDQSKEFIWDKIIGSSALDRSGKVSDWIPAIGFGAAVDEEALRKKMVQNAREIQWPLKVTWEIEPSRLVIVEEHAIRRRKLVFLVAGNPFVPPGHEGICVRGLQAGFLGDWLLAMHLLIPQLEASLRYVLQQRGVVTSTLDADRIQQERDINQLLWLPEIEEIFGVEIAFDLRGILIERFGHNMRNESAHGLMPEGAFYQPASVYLWWLTLRLCWIGYGLSRA